MGQIKGPLVSDCKKIIFCITQSDTNCTKSYAFAYKAYDTSTLHKQIKTFKNLNKFHVRQPCSDMMNKFISEQVPAENFPNLDDVEPAPNSRPQSRSSSRSPSLERIPTNSPSESDEECVSYVIVPNCLTSGIETCLENFGPWTMEDRKSTLDFFNSQ